MSRAELVDKVVAALCARLGLESVSLRSGDRLTLRFGDMPVTFSYRTEPQELLWIHADLGEMPQDGEAAPTFLLQVAFQTWSLNRMTVGLDPDGRRVWGFTCVPAIVLTDESLDQALQGLLEVALPLRQRLETGDFELPPAEASRESRRGGDGLRV